jgi:hypothetical protein
MILPFCSLSIPIRVHPVLSVVKLSSFPFAVRVVRFFRGSSFLARFCLGALGIRSNPQQTRVVLQNRLRFGPEATTPIRSKPHQTRANRSKPELLWETAGLCDSRFGIWKFAWP